MNNNWMSKSAWFELMSLAFLNTQDNTVFALTKGEYAEAFQEISSSLQLDENEVRAITDLFFLYKGVPADEIFHEIRKESTRLFIGAGEPLVTPFAGVWDSRRQGKKALLMVGKESMAIERFMRDCGVTRPIDYGGPLDHIGTLLEFMHYLCLVCADKESNLAEAAECFLRYEGFYRNHFFEFSQFLATNVKEKTQSNFFEAAARALLLLPEEAI